MSKIEYDDSWSCNNCSGDNEITKIVDTLNGYMCECETKCNECGFEDYWAYGRFESGQYIVSKCKKYSF